MKKSFKILSLIAIGSSMVIGTVALSMSGAFSNIYPAIGNGETVTKGVIEFLPENAVYNGGTTIVTGETVATKTPIICKITGNDTSIDYSGKVGAFYSGTEFHFYESDGITEYTFENFYAVTFYYDSDQVSKHTFDLKGLYNDGRQFEKHYNKSSSVARTLNFDWTGYGPMSHFYCISDNEETAKINKISITYSCTTKSIVGISLVDNPKTIYAEGEVFDTTGVLVDAEYSNGTHTITDIFTVSPSGPLSTSDHYVTISFGGMSYQQEITVVKQITSLSGRYNTYYNSDVSAYFDFDNNSYSRNGYTIYFTYEIVGTSIVFSHSSGSQSSMSGTYWLFKPNETTNSTSLLIEESSFTITLYSSSSGSTTKTFTKQ